MATPVPASPIPTPGYGFVASNDGAGEYRVDNVEIPDEPHPKTSAKWRKALPLSLKYVDDGMTIDKLNYETAPSLELLAPSTRRQARTFSGPWYVAPNLWGCGSTPGRPSSW